MADYNKQILNTIGLVTESALSKHTGFDKTLVATVIDASRAESKNYKLQYNEITFDAYSIIDEQYKTKDQVYFIVPSGDWNARKIILGKYEASGKKGSIYKQPFSNMIKASSNLNNSKDLALTIAPTTDKIPSNSDSLEIKDEDEFLRYGGLRKTEEFGEFDYIGLAFVIKGATFEPSNTSGSYGILLNLMLNDSEAFTNYTIFDSSQFFGNPYWCDGMRQELLIEYPKGSEVKDIQLQVYQNGNFNKPENVSEITFTNLEVYFGYQLSKFSQGKLVQYIPSNRSLQYSFKESDKVEVCPVYYALYHDGKIYGNKLKVGSPAGELELKWYKFQSGAAGTELSGANYVDLWQSELNGGWRVNLVDQSEIRIKMVAYPTNAEKPLYEHILKFNNTDKVITAEEEAQIAQSQQGDFQVKTYRSDDTAKFNATKFYAYDNTDNRLVSNFEIGLEVIPNDKVMKLTKGTITYNVLSSIPRLKKNEKGKKELDGVLATQLSYFVNKTYKKDITSKDENDEDVIETKTFSYWTPLDADGDVIYKIDSDGNQQYDFSEAATITCNYDYTPEDKGSKVTIPAAAIKLQDYLYPYRDNRIECIISQDGKTYKKIVNIDFDISNTAGTGYSLVVSPMPGEFEYGMQIADYLYDDKNNKTYKLRAQLFDQNHELVKDTEIYKRVNWNIENTNSPDNSILKVPPEKTNAETGETITYENYWDDVTANEDGSILTIHIKPNLYSMIVDIAENFMIITATIPSWTSSNGVKVNLKTKYPLATFGCFNALYYGGDYNTTSDKRLTAYRKANDLLTQFAYVCPSRIYYNPFGELITNYKATNLKVLPTRENKDFLDLLGELKDIINKNSNASIGEVKLGWVLNFEDKNIPLSISHEIDFVKSENGNYYAGFANSNYNKAKLAIQQLLMSNNNIKASIGLVIHYTRTDSEVRPYYLFQQPLLIERSHNTSEVLNSWDSNSIKLDDENDTVLSTAMVAGEKDGEGKFTGVMMGSLGTIGVDGISAKGSSGIYGFKGSNNRFYLNNNAEFFVGDSQSACMKFDDNGLILKGADFFVNRLSNRREALKEIYTYYELNDIKLEGFETTNNYLLDLSNLLMKYVMEKLTDIEGVTWKWEEVFETGNTLGKENFYWFDLNQDNELNGTDARILNQMSKDIETNTIDTIELAYKIDATPLNDNKTEIIDFISVYEEGRDKNGKLQLTIPYFSIKTSGELFSVAGNFNELKIENLQITQNEISHPISGNIDNSLNFNLPINFDQPVRFHDSATFVYGEDEAGNRMYMSFAALVNKLREKGVLD